MNFAVRLLILELLLVGSLTWMLARSFTPAIPYDLAVEQALDALDIAESDLRSNVLAARAGLLQNYDPLVDGMRTVRRESTSLRDSAEGGGERGRALAAAVDAQEGLLEDFKSQNAIVQNALATFDLLSARLTRAHIDPNLALAVGSLASILTHLSRQPSPELAQSANTWVEALSHLDFGPLQAEDAASLGRHGRLLVGLLPQLDNLLKRQQSLTLVAETRAISDDLKQRREHRERVSSLFHWALYGTAIGVSALLLRAALRLRSRTRALQARVDMETAIVKASNLFVACPPEEIDARLDEALDVLGTAERADRAYLLSFDLMRARLWTRPGCRPPARWPESRRALPSIIRGSPGRKICGQVTRGAPLGPLAEVLEDEGMTGLSGTVFGHDDAPLGVLVFERSVPFVNTVAQNEISLELIADVIAGAISRRDAARRRRDLERKLRRAERLQSLGTFASGIAHNFNNILGVIIGQAEMAATAPDAGPLAARHVKEIADAGQQAREIAGQILAFGRSDQRAPKVLEIEAILGEAVRQVEAALHGRATVVVQAEAGADRRVLADQSQLLQVLVNILQNAVQASDEGTPVVVTLDRIATRGERLSHGRLEAGSFLRITVADTGRGMAPEEAARMFEPFFTTRDGGTGLGLATARDTVGEMGGGFHVRSTPKLGTEVAIWLPETSRMSPDPSQGAAVLLLGGDRASVQRDEDLLAAIGYEPIGFAEARQALRALHKGTGRFDLAIIDQTVIEVGGPAVIQALRAALPNQQPILLSVPEGDEHPASEAVPGVAAVLMRPWRSSHVAATIARTLGS